MEWLFFIISYLDLWLISFYAVAIFNTFAAEENLLANQISTKHMKTKQLFTFLIALLLMQGAAIRTSAADFVDDINATSNKYAFGHRVIYEMNVGMFTSEGTFAAAQNKLSDLKKLGVDVIWLMPIYPRGGGLNSPYAATDFKSIKSSYGNLNNLKNFVNAAHNLNMEVWLDWVPNHTATNAGWVSSHPEYYTKSNGNFVNPSGYGDVYQLNYNNSSLVNAMNDCLKYWIQNAGIDGYRCDFVSSSGIPDSYWSSAIPLIKDYAKNTCGKSNFYFLAECDLDADRKGQLNIGWDYDYAWGFQAGRLAYDIGGNGGGTYGTTLKNSITNFFNNGSYGNLDRMMYLTNHDQNWSSGTLANMYGDNRYAFTVLEFTLYGMPLIYNGQEIGDNKKLDYFNDSKIDWNNVDYKMKNTIRTLTALKHSVDAFRDGKTTAGRGELTWLTTDNKSVLAYKRSHNGSEAIVVLNLGVAKDVTISGQPAGNYTQWLDSKTIANGVQRKSVSMGSSYTFNMDYRGYAVFVKDGSSSSSGNNSGSSANNSGTGKTNIYVKSNHNNINIWAWDSNGNSLNSGSWPGATLGAADANGWRCASYDASSVSFKFSDSGNSESGEYYNLSGNGYFYYMGSGLIKADEMPYSNGQKVAYFARQGSEDDWSAVSCYAWNSSGNAGLGGWPGKACTQVGTVRYFVNGTQVERKLWKIDLSNVAEGANLIFNNNNNGQQLADKSCQYGVFYSDAAYSVPVSSTSSSTSTPSKTITVYVKSNYSNINIYAWNSDGSNLGGVDWPGLAASSVKNGWHYVTFTADKVNFKFNDNGANESGEYYNLTSDAYFYYLGTALIKASEMKYNQGEKIAYFARQASEDDWSAASCYAWSGSGNAGLGNWPGKACTQAGTVRYFVNGTQVERKLWKIDLSNVAEGANLIFNNNNNGQQLADKSCQYGAFYTGNTYTVPTWDTSAYAKAFELFYDDEDTFSNTTNAITTINGSRDDRGEWFTLSGQRVAKPTKGIYIHNGRKVVVR